jgi:hypothetical protein
VTKSRIALAIAEAARTGQVIDTSAWAAIAETQLPNGALE